MYFQKKRRNTPEQQIQRAVIEHLLLRGVPDAFAFHVPLGGYRRPIEAAILKECGTVAGVPDLIIIHAGRVFALELKAPAGRVSDVQAAVHDRLRRAGAEVAVAWGLDQALAVLAGWGLLRGRS
jgi:hypothetical protein